MSYLLFSLFVGALLTTFMWYEASNEEPTPKWWQPPLCAVILAVIWPLVLVAAAVEVARRYV